MNISKKGIKKNNGIQAKQQNKTFVWSQKKKRGRWGMWAQKTESMKKIQNITCITFLIYSSSVAQCPQSLRGDKNNENFKMSGLNTASE